MAIKRFRKKKEISLSSKKKENYDSNTVNYMDLDQDKSKYLVPKLDGNKISSN